MDALSPHDRGAARLEPASSIHERSSVAATGAPGAASPEEARVRERPGRALWRGAFTLLATGTALGVVWAASTPVLDGAAQGVDWLSLHNDATGRAVATVAVVLVAALAWVFAWSRETAPRRAVRLASGHGTITVADVERALEALWLELPEIVAARASVENRRRHGIRVAARAAVTDDTRLADVLAAITAVTERFVHAQLGVDLAAVPRIELRYRELDLRAGRTHDIGAAQSRRRDAERGDAAG